MRSFPLLISFLCLSLPRSDHFRVRMRAALQVRAACVRACARPHYLSCWHGNRRQMNSCFAAGDALLVDGVHYSLCCRWINSVFPWITFFPTVRRYRYVRVVCVCMCSRPLAVEFYYKFDVEVRFFLKSAFYIRRRGITGSRDVH